MITGIAVPIKLIIPDFFIYLQPLILKASFTDKFFAEYWKLAGRSAYVDKKNYAIDILLKTIQKLLLDASKNEQFC